LARTMFRKLFGQGSGQGGGGGGPPNSAASTVRTVDAIQKLGEVTQAALDGPLAGAAAHPAPTPGAACAFSLTGGAGVQTEELLIKRRALLEKKVAAELARAKEYTKAQNKRGARALLLACSGSAACPHRTCGR